MKIKNLLSKTKQSCSNAYAKAGVVATMGLGSTGAFANSSSQNMFQPLIEGVDVASIKSGILSVGAVVIGISVVVMAVRKFKSMFSS
ncbi:hypothetical protein ACWIYZ_11310 [Ursidibacter arcticus]